MYALFKQAKQDPPFSEAKKPGMFDLTVSIPQAKRIALGRFLTRSGITGQGQVRCLGEGEGSERQRSTRAVYRLRQEAGRGKGRCFRPLELLLLIDLLWRTPPVIAAGEISCGQTVLVNIFSRNASTLEQPVPRTPTKHP